MSTDTAAVASLFRMLDDHGRLDAGGFDVMIGEFDRRVNDPDSCVDDEGRVRLANWLGALRRWRYEGADLIDTLRANAPSGFYQEDDDEQL